MKDRICIYEKFGFCRNGVGCKFTHPTLVCDDENCNIKDCLKRHPQACRFFTNYSKCKFGDTCKFLHRNHKDDTISKDEYNTLKDKYDVIVENYNQVKEEYSKLQGRVSSLETKFFDLMRNQIHTIQNDLNERNNLQSTTMDVQDESKDNKNSPSDVTIVSDDNMDYNLDWSYNHDDSLVHEIIDCEYDVCKYLDHEISDIKENLRGRIIDETLKKFNTIKCTIADKRNELKKLNGQHTDPEIEGDSEDTYKLMDEVVNMVEYLEKVPRKKFRNVSEKDLEIIMGKINVVLSNKQSNLHLLFNGPKSFVEN